MRRATRFALRYATAAGGAAWMLTLGLGRARDRALLQRVARHFGYDGRRAGALPAVPIERLVDATRPITLLETQSANGNVSLEELVALCRLVAHHRPMRLLEIGTFDGRTTLNLAANAPDGARVRTLDLPPTQVTAMAIEPGERRYVEKPQSGARFVATPWAARIEQLWGDSATYDFGPEPVDLAFVDGSHAYEYVLGDSRRTLALLPPAGGVIVWHDYGEWDGVTRALDELRATDPAFAGLTRIAGTTLVVLRTGAAARG